MILDGHIHVSAGRASPRILLSRLRQAGASGALIISRAPPSFGGELSTRSSKERLESLFEWTEGTQRLYPFYWIDPLEARASHQVGAAVARGVAGFKVICNQCAPGDRRAMRIYKAIAETGRPILFHSGILWDGRASSQYNRPAAFEALLEVRRLRFALAHISWPWCDELIAVYGKFQMALRSRPELGVEMYVDTTPGTPPIYRREALTRLLTVGYDIERNVFFGTDCTAQSYNVRWAKEWIGRDRRICQKLGLSAAAKERLFAGNLKRFVRGNESGRGA